MPPLPVETKEPVLADAQRSMHLHRPDGVH
jgi:hypothetical protein